MLVLGEDRSADLRFQETRRDFVANITHELKTPIGAITLLAEAVDGRCRRPGGRPSLRWPARHRVRVA